jgi:dihydrofolate synthase/folylpolyglutamate synthase
MMAPSYQEAVSALLAFADFERSGRFAHRPDVGPMLALLHALGDPHLQRATVHIAGSKGKGSVAAMVASALSQAGMRVGLYTSPHLDSYCERIRIDGRPITEQDFARLAWQVLAAAEEAAKALPQRQLVTFDLLTAMAFLAFREAKVDVQVIEVGLGGRLDSTNVFPAKEATVITPIGLEHTAILGPTPAHIAKEKAAIACGPGPVVMAPQYHREAEEVIRQVTAERGLRLVEVATAYSWKREEVNLQGQRFVLRWPAGELKLWLPLLGAHQMENAATAVASLHALASMGISVPQEAIREGLARVRWPARLEVLSPDPLVVVDGAHNRESALRLRQALQEDLGARKAIMVVGTLADKDLGAIAQELAPITRLAIAPAFQHPRAMDAAAVAAAFRSLGLPARTAPDVATALDIAVSAMEHIEGPWVICLTGSLAFAAEARRAFLKRL